MSWRVYIVRCSDGTLYTGATPDIAHRIRKHNSGKGAKYTRGRLPVSLAWRSWPLTKSEALSLEHRIKKLQRRYKLQLTSCLSAGCFTECKQGLCPFPKSCTQHANFDFESLGIDTP